MYLYLCQSGKADRQNRGSDPAGSSGFSEIMVWKALRDYCERRKLLKNEQELAAAVIQRSEKGKPYFSGCSQILNGTADVHFSVSHSGEYWGCLMAEEPIGFDMEVLREKVDYEKIARRFFAAEECEMILSEGRDLFFEIWVRKEAYVKYLGTGLGEGLSSFSVVAEGKLSSQVIGTSCSIRSCEIHAGVKAAYCSASGDPLLDIIELERRY